MSSYLPPPPNPGAGGWNPVGPYATSSMPMPPMRSLKGLSVALLVLFAIVALVDIIGAGALFNRASLLDDFIEGRAPSFFAKIDDADSAVVGTLGFHVVLAVALAAVFITWQWRHAKNAELLGARGGLGPGWAVGGWFIPLANFVLPAAQLFQSSQASDVQARAQGRPPKGAGIIIVWALVFGLAAVLFSVGGGLRPSDDEGNVTIDSIDDVRSAASGDRTAGAGMVAFVVAAGVGAVMVRRLTRKQSEAYATAASGATPGGFSAPGPPAPPAPPSAWAGPSPPAPPSAPAAPPARPPIPPPPGAPPPPPA